MDLGLGKTGTILAYLYELIGRFVYTKFLIVGPLKVVNQTWPSEFAKWQNGACIDYSVITGTAEECEHAMRSDALVHLVNVDRLGWLIDKWKGKWPYEVVIIDEASAFKSHDSKRLQKLAGLRKGFVSRKKGVTTRRPSIHRLVELTASPATEGYEGLFAQMFLLDLGQRLGKFITHYRNKYFTQNKYSFKHTLTPGSEEKILKRIADIVLIMKRRDYLDFEEPIFRVRSVELSPREHTLYKTMQRESLVTLDDGVEIEAEFAASLSSKLTQMASGAMYDEEGISHFVHNRKIEELQSLVEEANGKTLLVAYWYKSSLERLKAAFPKAVVLDKKGSQVDRWNTGKIDMMFLHPQSAGHGLNLQHGGHHLVFFDLPWSLELYLQLIGRLDRQGQKFSVIVHHLIAKGTIDEQIYSALQSKQDVQEALFTMLKNLRARLLRHLRKMKLLREAEGPVDL